MKRFDIPPMILFYAIAIVVMFLILPVGWVVMLLVAQMTEWQKYCAMFLLFIALLAIEWHYTFKE